VAEKPTENQMRGPDQSSQTPEADENVPAAKPDSTRRRFHLNPPSVWMAWLLVLVASLGIFVGSPPSAGPDEPAHETTAWYMTSHILPPRGHVDFEAPAIMWRTTPCYAFNPAKTAACFGARSSYAGFKVVHDPYSPTSYPPVYYWVVGLGERIAVKVVGPQWADIGGRVASIILNMGVLLAVCLYMRRRHPLWGSFLLMLVTPMTAFLYGVVNPNGWEITCGIALGAALAEAAWARRAEGPLPRSAIAFLMLASIGLCLARPLGFIWALGLTISALVIAPAIPRRSRLLSIGMAVAPGIILGLLWFLFFPTTSPGITSKAVPVTPGAVVTWFTDSLLLLHTHLFQMWGDLGWLDTPAPMLLFVVWIAAWGVLLARMPSLRKAALACGVFGIFILPGLVEATGWGSWPHWWQGRYSLPFACGFILMLLLRSGARLERLVAIVSGVALLSVGAAVWTNTIRYAYGLDAYGLPARFDHPALGTGRLVAAMLCGLLVFGFGCYMLIGAYRMKPDACATVEAQAS
jgi:Predicted membrane protein (DUF2142)